MSVMEPSRGLELGRPAPPIHVQSTRTRLTFESLGGQPVVLAFLERWTPLEAGADELAAVRAELRGLGAVLIALSSVGLFVFRPDDEVELFAAAVELDADDVARTYD